MYPFDTSFGRRTGFHALQNVQTHFKEIYGTDYVKNHPQALTAAGWLRHIIPAGCIVPEGGSILKQALKGMLVAQDPRGESADELLKKFANTKFNVKV